ncbi:YybH family protein [Lysinibacter cavernae]|uniref:Ketosteroid isomerase-like protein n=1 Tax=Lysinibacter cavernae TaxID=1640652 RepID=A0A7X5R3G0_9MICO|nr:nuclear transport factor 2 family protein [Lysinibacter cavernae]NIH54050.1 ketosteroid isomerase-like protein [Lysinibacter cavernae]NIH54943.1 ketosteroid isomerase-like protein [Lysinibacter cavernae]
MTRETPAALTSQEVASAADHLVAAFSSMDADAYFGSFAPDATFIFYPEQARLNARAEYEALWAEWVEGGWKITGCESSNQLIQIAGDTGIFTHDVATSIEVDGTAETLHERETIVFVRDETGAIVAVHEHLSPTPAANPEEAVE